MTEPLGKTINTLRVHGEKSYPVHKVFVPDYSSAFYSANVQGCCQRGIPWIYVHF